MSNFNLLKVIEVEKLTSNAVALSFQIPYNLKNEYTFISGQYLPLELLINKVKVRRSYSICSGPDEVLKIGIKKVTKGVFSNYVIKHIKAGDMINVGVPEGRFFYHSTGGKEVITGIAAGSGITPILSIAKSVLNANKKNEFRLIYGNKSLSDEMFSSEIKGLKDHFGNRFKVMNLYSQSNEKESKFGRINDSIINYYINLHGKADKYFICGPEPMIFSVLNVLLTKKVSKEQILYELFTTNKKNTLKNSITKVSSLDIIYEGVKYHIDNISGKTVLEAAIESGIDVPYSCQGGVCSSCVAKVMDGNAKMKTNQVLTEEEIKDGLILTCQAESKQEYLKVNFDDV
ncbi:MAG: 2Fe-2S iron-sulfur cluster-binding protein [Flavobacteriaceae bacterium]|nr:2Fe-2S iron-sulfur cluster-binding protein [Flavobacteriaceae bacterium]